MMGTGQRLQTRAYRFHPGVVVRLRSSRRSVISYFDEEYGPPVAEGADAPHLDVHVGPPFPEEADGEASWYRGRHKTIRWKLRISGFDGDVTRVAFEGKGTMAISFLQTFYLEPLIRLRVAELGAAMVHAGTIETDGRCVLLVGGTAVGKTTVVTLQAVRGRGACGDNYAIVMPDGKAFAIPRRVRLYSDFPRANPEGHRRLSMGKKLRLRFLRLARILSFGYANVPLRLRLAELGANAAGGRGPAALRALFVLTRHGGDDIVGPNRITTERVIEWIQAISQEEAEHLRLAVAPYLDAHPQSRYARAAALETAVLRRAFEGLPAYEVLVPRVKDPGPVASRLLDLLRAD